MNWPKLVRWCAVAGLGAGAVLFALAKVSLAYYHQGRLCKLATAASMLVSMALAVVMQERYQATGKLFPAGFITGLSTVMSLYYVWNLIAGPVPKKNKAP